MNKQSAAIYQKARQAIRSGQVDHSILAELESIADNVPDKYWPEYCQVVDHVRGMI